MLFRIAKILALIAALGAGKIFAEELPEAFHPVRPNAMGGAWTAIANDENAVWTNPAGIARIRKARSRSKIHLIKFPNLIAGANTSGRSFYDSLQAKDDDNSASSISSTADKLDGKPLWALTSIFPMIMFDAGNIPTVAGAFSHTTIKAVADSENPQQASTQIVSDLGGTFGMAFTTRSNRFQVGLQARYIGRYAFEEVLPIETLTDQTELKDKLTHNANKSTAVALDAGMMWTIADFWFPTIGLAVYNLPIGCKNDYLNPFSEVREKVCGTKFTGKFSNEDAISVLDPTDIRMGISITPRISRKLGARIGLDLHHFHVASGDANYGFSNVPALKTVHGGIELFWGNPLLPAPFSVSMGASQGYYTMGATIRFPYFSIDFASFGRDISSTDSPKEDRRNMVGVSAIF